MAKTVTIESLLTELRELRLLRDRADARLMLRAMEIETEHMEVILAGGCGSFAQFLKSADSLIEPGRYESFKAGLAKVGAKQALLMGSDATIVAGQLSNGPEEYCAAIDAWVMEHDGTLPTMQTARHIRMQVDPRHEVPDAVRKQDELAQLRAENALLRAENAALKNEVAKLRKSVQKSNREKA